MKEEEKKTEFFFGKNTEQYHDNERVTKKTDNIDENSRSNA